MAKRILKFFHRCQKRCCSIFCYGATSALGKVKTEIRLAVLPAEAAAEQLLAVPAANSLLQPSGAEVVSIMAESDLKPLFGSNESLKTKLWSDPNNAAALQHVKLRHGDKIWRRSYRFQHNGVYHQRQKPAGKKKLELPPER